MRFDIQNSILMFTMLVILREKNIGISQPGK